MRIVDKNHKKIGKGKWEGEKEEEETEEGEGEGRQRREGLKHNFCTLVAEGRKKREMMGQSEWKDNCNLVKWMPREE